MDDIHELVELPEDLVEIRRTPLHNNRHPRKLRIVCSGNDEGRHVVTAPCEGLSDPDEDAGLVVDKDADCELLFH
jgi:hypothetical protein